MIARMGCAVVKHVSQTARRSSPMLSAQLEKGSGTVLAAARVLALAPWEVRAIPPAQSAAIQRHSGPRPAETPKARTAAAGGRMKVWRKSQTVAGERTLLARKSR